MTTAPSTWRKERHRNGAFTVEIASISVHDGFARYKILVLYNDQDIAVRAFSVDRRYSEFYQLAQTVDRLVPGANAMAHLPSRTLFQSLLTVYLERRSAQLQAFLEYTLGLQADSLFGMKLEIATEPTVRRFLNLAPVEWNVVPRVQHSRAEENDPIQVRSNSARRESLFARSA